MCVALVPIPAAASDSAVEGKPAQTQPAAVSPQVPTLATSMARIVARDVASARPVAARRAEQGATQGPQSASFFKTRTGAVIAAVMIAGTGYALYSAKKDRIHSPGKN